MIPARALDACEWTEATWAALWAESDAQVEAAIESICWSACVRACAAPLSDWLCEVSSDDLSWPYSVVTTPRCWSA
jgi:hypothetical protein